VSRIQPTFAALAAQGRKALIPFVTAGDPFADATPRSCTAWWPAAPT
jgi:tryptophan synthase alpha chain